MAVINHDPENGRFPKVTQPVVNPGGQLGWFIFNTIGVFGDEGMAFTLTVLDKFEVQLVAVSMY